MDIWIFAVNLILEMRPAFSRQQTFFWFATAVAGTMTRTDVAGVTSIVRALGLDEIHYDRLLDFFHSRAVDIVHLRRLWTRAILRTGVAYKFNDRIVIAADGVKNPKEGRKMPGVKSLHQESASNSKPEYIMGHSCQAVALVCRALASFVALPLGVEIHEGLVFSNRDKRTLLDKILVMIDSLDIGAPFYLLADAYYASGKIAKALMKRGCHLVSRVRGNAVAFQPVRRHRKRRGRKRKFGTKVVLRKEFAKVDLFQEIVSPVDDNVDIKLKIRVMDLLWRPIGEIVRFVLVIHPTFGNTIYMTTDTALSGIDIIKLYGLRFRIEVSFKQAIHVVGVYAYHFWMKGMKRIRRGGGDQCLHHQPEEYRMAVRRKMAAYNLFMQVGVVAQGIMNCLAILNPKEVWASFGSWIRTIRPGLPPSELVTADALRNKWSEFLVSGIENSNWLKFVARRQCPRRGASSYAKTG